MSEVLHAAVLLILIMDPLGNVPVFLSVLKDTPEERRHRIILREMFIALGVLLLFLFFGGPIMRGLGLEAEAISIGGGIVLFLIAIRMIFPPERGGVTGHQAGGEPFIVPLAIPLVAGPSTMAALMLFVQTEPGLLWHWLAALVLAWGVTAAILFAAPELYRVLKARGLIAMERLMGMLLVIIAVQMFLDGLKSYLGVGAMTSP